MTQTTNDFGRVYLAGPIKGLTYGESTDWRVTVAEELTERGIQVYSPMRGKEYLAQEKGPLKDTYDSVLSNQRAIFDRDKFDVHRADVLLVNLLDAPAVSIGTMFEVAWAKQADIPVVLVIEDAGNLHDHAFVRESASFRVNTLQQAVFVIARMLQPHFLQRGFTGSLR